jgi:hypothetical protein
MRENIFQKGGDLTKSTVKIIIISKNNRDYHWINFNIIINNKSKLSPFKINFNFLNRLKAFDKTNKNKFVKVIKFKYC